jgi:hypothetical protein
MMGALIGLCANSKLDIESFVHGMTEAKKCFAQPSLQRDEFSLSLVEQIWIKQAELSPSDKMSQDAFKTSMKPLLT